MIIKPQSSAFVIIKLCLSIFAIKLSLGLNGNKLSSTKAFSGKIECLYDFVPVDLDLNSTLYNLGLVRDTMRHLLLQYTDTYVSVYKYIH